MTTGEHKYQLYSLHPFPFASYLMFREKSGSSVSILFAANIFLPSNSLVPDLYTLYSSFFSLCLKFSTVTITIAFLLFASVLSVFPKIIHSKRKVVKTIAKNLGLNLCCHLQFKSVSLKFLPSMLPAQFHSIKISLLFYFDRFHMTIQCQMMWIV